MKHRSDYEWDADVPALGIAPSVGTIQQLTEAPPADPDELAKQHVELRDQHREVSRFEDDGGAVPEAVRISNRDRAAKHYHGGRAGGWDRTEEQLARAGQEAAAFRPVGKDPRLAAPYGEADPTGRSPKQPGAKLDAGKPPVLRGAIQYFPRGMKAVACISQGGAEKYAWNGWESVPDGVDRYGDALGRHLCDEAIGKFDPADQRFIDLLAAAHPAWGTTELMHAAQDAWNALARFELLARKAEQLAAMGNDPAVSA